MGAKSDAGTETDAATASPDGAATSCTTQGTELCDGFESGAIDDKIRRELGWRPRVEFSSGLAATVQWYRDNPDWWRPLLTT